MRGLMLLALAALGLGCPKPEPKPYAPEPPQTLADGLIVQTLRAGEGRGIEKNDKIKVHYVGTLADGTKFDSSRDRDRPFEFWVGHGMVIDGWDLGLIGAKEGEVRKLTVPPRLGYGSRDMPKIPGGSTLIFEIEVLGIR